MGNGAPPTRAVARLVLLDSKFSHMPYVPRRRSSRDRKYRTSSKSVRYQKCLQPYLRTFRDSARTFISVSTAPLVAYLLVDYRYSVVLPGSTLLNNRRYIPGFLKRVLRFAVPIGFIVAAAAMYTLISTSTLSDDISIQVASSAAVISVVTIGLWVLACLGRPLKGWKIGLITTMGVIFYLAISWPWLSGILKFQSVWPYNFEGFFGWTCWCASVELVWRFDQRRQDNLVEF